MKLRKKTKSGFSLIEVIISICIIIIILIPVMNMIATTSKTQYKSKQKQQATEIGQSKLEELCANSSINLIGNSFTDLDNNVFSMTQDVNGTWTGINNNIDGYTVKFTLSKGKTNFATSTVVNYNNNKSEVDKIKNVDNYSNVLTFENYSIKYQDELGVDKYYIIDNTADTVYVDVDGNDIDGINAIILKKSLTDSGETINIKPSKKLLEKIKIIQGYNDASSTELKVNIASKIDIDADFMREKNIGTTDVILANYAHDDFKGSISTIQGVSEDVIPVSDNLYTVSIEVHDSHGKTIFNGQETKNIKIKT